MVTAGGFGVWEGGQRVGVGRRVVASAFAAGVLAAAVAGSACSADVEGVAPSSAPVSVTVPATTVVEGGGTTTVVEAPVTFPSNSDAEQVVAELEPRLPMSDAERACVVAAIDGDGDLLARLGGGVAPGSGLFDEVTGVLSRCKVRVTQAPMFAASVDESVGGTLTATQTECLSDGFAALSAQDLDAVMAAALDPAGELASAGTGVLEGVLAACGVPARG